MKKTLIATAALAAFGFASVASASTPRDTAPFDGRNHTVAWRKNIQPLPHVAGPKVKPWHRYKFTDRRTGPLTPPNPDAVSLERTNIPETAT